MEHPEKSLPPENQVDDQPYLSRMSFWAHLDELRTTLFKCLGIFILCAGLVAIFLSYTTQLLKWPLEWAGGENVILHTTSVMGVFIVALQVCLFGGVSLSLPLVVYFFAQFFAPALNPKERKLLKYAIGFILLLFFIGAIFSFILLVPASIKASLFLNEKLGYTTIWTADKYYSLLVWMVIGTGLSFEMPLIIILLVFLKIITSEQLKTFRPYSIVGFLILAAIITPTTDPFTFMLLAIPLILLYELALYIGKKIEKKHSVED